MEFWVLDPAVAHLNHGSFGACPAPVLAAQHEWRQLLEGNPTRFMAERYQPALEVARSALAAFVGADREGLVPVANASAGVNAVLRSIELRAGDQVLVTDHGYNACRNAAEAAARRAGAEVVVAPVPFPLRTADQVVEAVLARVTARTRLVVIDHITSPTALILPVAQVAAALEPDVPVLVDGAHAPGMVPLSLDSLGASFVVGNCHKWLCSPKGAGFLWVAARHRSTVEPVSISHGWNGSYSASSSRFHALFDWTGTTDPTAWLSIPDAIRVMGELMPGGWPALLEANRRLAQRARRVVGEALEVDSPSPDDMIGSMASLPLPPRRVAASDPMVDPLTAVLRGTWSIEVSVFVWPAPPGRLVRISAQAYNQPDQYRRLGEALRVELADE